MAKHRHRHHVPIDAVFYSERDMVELRNDLLDTHIYICAPEVLMLFSDNFDYQVWVPALESAVFNNIRLLVLKLR